MNGLTVLYWQTALTPIIWGSTYIVTTQFLPPDTPLFAALMRALPAGLILIALSPSLPRTQDWLKLATLGALNIGWFFFCLFYAANKLPGGTAALLMTSQPVMVIALSWLILGIRPLLTHGVAACAGIAGVTLLVANSQTQLDNQAVLLALAGTFSMALGIVLTKHWGRPQGMSILSFTGWQLLLGGVLLMPFTLYLEGIPNALTATHALGYAYLVLIGAVLAYYLWFRGIAQLPATSISFLALLSSLSATVLGYLWLDETLTPIQALGALLIISSVWLAGQTAATRTRLNRFIAKRKTV